MAERPYTRVYHAIVDDPKFSSIYDDDHRLATWLRLLIVADQAYPSSAIIPFGTHRASLNVLCEVGLIDIGTGQRFRIHGLDAERSRRSEAAKVGGFASGRSRAVERVLNERSTESNLAEPRLDKTSNTRASADEWRPPRPKVSAVDRDPLLREMRAAQVERYGNGMDEPTIKEKS